MGSAAAGPISDKTARGARVIGSWVRARVRLGAVTTSSTAKGHLNPGLTNDDRDEDREGVYGFESPAAPGSSPRKHV